MDANTPILTGTNFTGDPSDIPPPNPMLVQHLQEVFKWKAPARTRLETGMDGAVNVAMEVSAQHGRDEVIQYLFNLVNQEK